MQLVIKRKDLLKSLARTHTIADRKSSMPILSNILISTEGPKTLRLAATDLYISVTSMATAEVKKGGTVAVPARTIFEIVRNLPEGEVKLNTLDNNAFEILSGKVRFKIPGMPGEDFPSLPIVKDVEFVDLSMELVGRLVTLTHYAMSTDETRPHLSGAMFEGDGKTVRMVATDGHRLSKAEQKLPDGAKMLNFKMLVPAKGISELKRMIEEESRNDRGREDDRSSEIGVTTSAGNAFFRREDVTLSIRLSEEDFPPYSKVIPQANEKKVFIARNLMIDALRRISLLAREKTGVVHFVLASGKLIIKSENPELGEGLEEIDVDYAGDELEIGFNARYLIDVLSSVPEENVIFELNGELDPGLIRPDGPTDFVGVIMPMRI
jgi:DNA polymerase-3 subunit beta